mgnify:CR=1 FL=1
MMRTIEKIVSLSTIIETAEKLNVVTEDAADNKILECAKAGKVDYVISKYNHLLKLKEFEKIRIVSPREFLTED